MCMLFILSNRGGSSVREQFPNLSVIGHHISDIDLLNASVNLENKVVSK